MKMVYRSIILAIVIICNFNSIRGQGIIGDCKSAGSFVSCNRNVILIDHSENISSFTIDIVVTSNNQVLYSNSVYLSDPVYFQYLGSEIINSITVDGYRLHALSGVTYGNLTYPIITTTATDNSNPIAGTFTSSIVKPCGMCPEILSRYEMHNFYYSVFSSQCGLVVGLNPFPDFTNSNWGADIGAVTNLLNWMINNASPTVNDWINVLDESNFGQSEIPVSFVQYSSLNCICYMEIYQYYFNFVKFAQSNWNNYSTIVVDELFDHLDKSCDCSSFYCTEFYEITNTNLTVRTIALLPVYRSFIPALVLTLVKDGANFYSEISYSFDFDFSSQGCLDAFDCIGDNRISYYSPQGQHEFVYDDPDFHPLYELIDSECNQLPCSTCIGSFSPYPGQEYILSAWTREGAYVADEPITISTFESPSITLLFEITGPSTTSIGPFDPSGPVIDGWQKIESSFTVPATAINLTIKLSAQAEDVYFDDIRISPKKSNMKSFVYDQSSRKLVAELDEQNFATFYEYDQEGKLVRIKKESERGILTIKENRSNLPKR